MTYAGGKGGAGVYQTIINLMPVHDVYIEPFVGGGSIINSKLPARLNVAIDRSEAALYQTMLQLRDLAPQLLTMSDRTDADETVSAAIAGIIAGRREDTRRISPIWAILRDDAISWLREHRAEMIAQTFVYCDPPYVRSSRRGSRDLYEYELTDEQHVELLNILKSLPCMVLISGYHSQLYTDLLSDWNTSTFTTTVRSGATATEHVWFNYPKPVELHDYRYLGNGFRERERIKRKMKRWQLRLNRMPELERQALLWAMKSETAPAPER